MRCGLIPEDNPPEFFAKHLSAYHFLKKSTADKTVLEVGFGDGYGMSYLAEVARHVSGVDIAPENIPLAKAKYPKENLSFVHFDGYHFPFKDKSFDFVCTFQVIEHIPETRLVEWLSEIKRVLKDDGSFYVSTLNLETAMKPGSVYEKNIDHEKEFKAHELDALLKRVFARVELRGLHYSFKHLVFKRLKKWGLLKLGFVRRHFDSVSVDDFVVTKNRIAQSVDLFAVCGK